MYFLRLVLIQASLHLQPMEVGTSDTIRSFRQRPYGSTKYDIPTFMYFVLPFPTAKILSFLMVNLELKVRSQNWNRVQLRVPLPPTAAGTLELGFLSMD